MANSETQIDRLIKPILRKIHGRIIQVRADFEDLDGSPATPAEFDTSEPVEKGVTELYTQKYGKDILAADTYEDFSALITEIASLEGLNVNSDLEEVAKVANLIRERHSLEPL